MFFIKSIYNFFRSILENIHLNLGIKTLLRKIGFSVWVYFDTYIMDPLLGKLSLYKARRIIAYYGADYKWGDERSQNISKKGGNLGYGDLMHVFVKNLKPKRILCIGSMYGFIPFMLASACKGNGIGHVDFVDASYDIHDNHDKERHAFGQGFWRRIDIKKHFSYLDVNKYLTAYIITSEEFAKKYPQRKFDVIYVDGDHRYQGVKKDFTIYWKRLNRHGFMIFHDVEKRGVYGGIEFGFWKLWEELKKKHRNYILFPNPISGLGIIQKD